MSDITLPQVTAPKPVVARRAVYFRNTRIAVLLIVWGSGGYFLYDGFVGYPSYNQRFLGSSKADQLAMERPHSQADITLQRQLGFLLMPLGLILAGWFVYRSRGEYREFGETLYAPGHPPVPLSCIVDVDRSKWERKGIADVEYALPDGRKGKIRLDDFVYERRPIDQIVSRIRIHCESRDEAAAV